MLRAGRPWRVFSLFLISCTFIENFVLSFLLRLDWRHQTQRNQFVNGVLLFNFFYNSDGIRNFYRKNFFLPIQRMEKGGETKLFQEQQHFDSSFHSLLEPFWQINSDKRIRSKLSPNKLHLFNLIESAKPSNRRLVVDYKMK